MRAGGVINDHAVVAQFAVNARHNHRIAERNGNTLNDRSHSGMLMPTKWLLTCAS